VASELLCINEILPIIKIFGEVKEIQPLLMVYEQYKTGSDLVNQDIMCLLLQSGED
jgi:hypothetical protein